MAITRKTKATSVKSSTIVTTQYDRLGLTSLSQGLMDFPDPALVVDDLDRIVFMNQAAEKLLGIVIDKDNLPPARDILHLDIEGPDENLLDYCLEGKQLHRTPLRLRIGEGNWQSLTVTANLIKDQTGKPAGVLAVIRDLKSDLLTQPAMKDQLALLSSILGNFPTPFFTVDTNLTVTHMNRQMERLTGYNHQEVVNRMTCGEILCTSKCNTEECFLRRAIETKMPVSGVRNRVVDREGKEIPVVVNASIITDADEQIVGGFEFIRDISARVEAEQKIEMVTELTQEGILMLDEDYHIVFANSKMAAITGFNKEQLIGMAADRIIPPHYYQMVVETIQKVNRGEQLCFCSIMEPPGTGSDDYLDFETCMAVSTIGKKLITCMYFRDLSRRNEYERELRQAKSFLENVIRSSVDGIVVVDTTGNVLYFNEGAENILGYKAAEVIGHSEIFRNFYDPETAREIMRRMRSSEHGPPGKLNKTRLIFKSKSGEDVPVNFSAAIIKEGDREIGSVGIFSDRRESLRIRKELEEAKMQLWQTEKISSLGRLAAAVAHEINNPLAGILIYADMLMREIGSNPQWREDLEEIRTQTLRCKQIVTRLLEFSRMPLGQRVSFDVNEVIRNCVEFLCHQELFFNIKIILGLADDLPSVVGDPAQIQQVITNIIINAAKAMEGKGTLIIRSDFIQDNQEVILMFKDSGPGIPSLIIDKIFEPFFTTKSPGEGTGLGLSVCYGIMQQHGGRIEAKNAPEGGAIFILTLPREAPQHEELFELID